MAAVVAPIAPPPPSGGNGSLPTAQLPPWKSNAVDRSNEFLSASRTALKIAQQQHRQRQQQPGYDSQQNGNASLPEWMVDLQPAQLRLHQRAAPSYENANHDDTVSLIRDSQTLLQLLDGHLSELHSLVRRRGHTNDPTLEIQNVMEKFQEGAREVKDVCDSLRMAGTKPCMNAYHEQKRSSSQRRKHFELLSQQLEGQAKERTDKLKKELETRSQVLRDQSHRRKLLASGGGAASAASGAARQGGNPPLSGGMRPAQPTRLPPQKALNATAHYQSPLFTATSGGTGAAACGKKNGSATAYPAYAGYGGSSAAAGGPASATRSGGYAGYGGTTSAPPSFGTGMRQRKQQQPIKSHIQIDGGTEDDDYENKYDKSEGGVQQQISLRREKRATKNRAQQARLAEKSIAELGVMFNKMSSLISQQGEVLERIEDDVEAAGADIDAGHDELVKVYGMTKGNRGLILKVFGILIFLIIFMKLY